MHIFRIEAHSSRTFNHPFESYSNFRMGVTLLATVWPWEDKKAAARRLFAQADAQAEEQKQAKLKALQPARRVCRVCGCDDDHSCLPDDGGPCWWVHPDLCSACAYKVAAGDEDDDDTDDYDPDEEINPRCQEHKPASESEDH